MTKAIQSDETFHRSIEIDSRLIDAEERTVKVIASTEAPVERWFGVEVLAHDGDAVDMSRMNDSAALLSDHDWNRQIGVVVPGTARLEGRKLKATVRFSRSEAGEREFQDVQDGIRTKLSIGYRIHDLEPDGNDAEGREVYRVTRWEPFEVSLVAIPADVGAKVGRSRDGTQETKHKLIQAMAEDKNKPAEKPVEKREAPAAKPDPIESVSREELERMADKKASEKVTEELARRDGLASIGKTYGFEKEAEKAIRDGKQVEEFVTEVRKAITARIENDPWSVIPGARGEDYSKQEQRDFSGFRFVEFLRQQHEDRQLSGLYKEAAEEFQAECKRWGIGGGIGVPSRILSFGKRDHTATGGTGGSEGGATVATDLRSIIDVFNSAFVLNNLGVTFLRDLQGNVEFPKPTKGSDPTEKSENAAADEYSATFGKVSMTPKRLPSTTQISTQLLRQSSIDVENWVRNQIGVQLALRMQNMVINGSGSSSQPQGLLNASGLGTVTTSGTLTWAKIVEFETDVNSADALMGNLGWLTTPAVRGEAKSTEKATNTGIYLLVGNEMNGYPVYTSTTVPSQTLIFGNWSDLYVGMWGGLSTVVDPYTNATTGLVNITLESFYDSAVARAASFSVATDV